MIPEFQKKRLIELFGEEKAKQIIESTIHAVGEQIKELTSEPERRKKYRQMVVNKLEEIIRRWNEKRVIYDPIRGIGTEEYAEGFIEVSEDYKKWEKARKDYVEYPKILKEMRERHRRRLPAC